MLRGRFCHRENWEGKPEEFRRKMIAGLLGRQFVGNPSSFVEILGEELCLLHGQGCVAGLATSLEGMS